MRPYRSMLRGLIVLLLLAVASPEVRADDGYDLWLRYERISDAERLAQYRSAVSSILVDGDSPTLQAAQDELQRGLEGLLAESVPLVDAPEAGTVVAGTPAGSDRIAQLELEAALREVGPEGFVIRTIESNGVSRTVIAANEDIGVLYGVFHLLTLMQTHQPVSSLDVVSAPEVEHRVLNHWDNLDRTVERGYAGFSLWDWWNLPEYQKTRYVDYARANASLGINGTVLTNVNADATVLTPRYLKKVASLAECTLVTVK